MALQGDDFNMKVMFRADASIDIGTGHVMRCLTLASALKEHGAECRFICRAHRGNLIQTIQESGFEVTVLPLLHPENLDFMREKGSLAHANWLGAAQSDDATECSLIVKDFGPDWLIVDHYAVDFRWQQLLKPHYKKLMVIDDLADRKHLADILLDQTFGRSGDDYSDLVPHHCTKLCGTEYAILRPEFSKWRDLSLSRRNASCLKKLLVNLGGVDKDNITGQVLKIIKKHKNLPGNIEIVTVLGKSSPWADQIKVLAASLPYKVTVMIGITNMAELMSTCDLAIGAAGATSWERCALGVPSILIVLAENQELIGKNLQDCGAAVTLGREHLNEGLEGLTDVLDRMSRFKLSNLSENSAKVCDGLGVDRVISSIEVQQLR
ncbi:UDP-2,4-diacetamido-2,4,6-trideoxy-beta-L-altropyranose hydrolase [Pseudidiomarina gelatinasegens]|uniref:UDP-2,4-diacetamido-2,4, 6-trideoxy-beta-L-altropyranose hydrolase n=1 Tax=Pseudidiomarina gelatinasegens TaxID=2487740 RepID=UPI003A976243